MYGPVLQACSSVTFPRIMGPTLANEMLLLGRKFTAAEACDAGLVSPVFRHDLASVGTVCCGH